MLTGRAGRSRRSYPRKSRGKAHGGGRLSRLAAIRPAKAAGCGGAVRPFGGNARLPPCPLHCRIERRCARPRQFPRPDAERRAKRRHRRRIDITDAGRQKQGRGLRIDRPQRAAADAIPPTTAQPAPVARAGNGGGREAAEQFVGGIGGRVGLRVLFHRTPSCGFIHAAPRARGHELPALSPHGGFGRGAGAASFGRFGNGTCRRPVRCLFPAIAVSLHGPAPSPGPPLTGHRPGRCERTACAAQSPVHLCAAQARPDIHDREGNHFLPGPSARRASPSTRKGTGPASPATRSGVSVAGRRHYAPTAEGGENPQAIFFGRLLSLRRTRGSTSAIAAS